MPPPVVVHTGSEGTLAGLAEAVASLDAVLLERPLISFVPPEDWSAADLAAGQLGNYGAIVFTSPRAARLFRERVAQVAPVLEQVPPVWVTGAATEKALRGLFGPVLRAPSGEESGGGALAEAMIAAQVRSPVLFPCGQLRREELPERLAGAGLTVVELTCYYTVVADEAAAREAIVGAAVVLVASPSVAQLLGRAVPPTGRPRLAAIGSTTAAAARAAGWPPDGVAARPETDAVVDVIRSLLASR